MKTLVIVDGSAYSAKVCRWAAALARELRKSPEITLFNVDAPLSNGVVATGIRHFADNLTIN